MIIKKSIPTYKEQHFLATVQARGEKNKQLVPNSPIFFQQYVNGYRISDPITIILRDKKPKRSIAQNNYYHLYLTLISLSSGHNTDELHEWVKQTILSRGITEIFGSTVKKVKSTTQLTRLEFCEMLARIEDITGIDTPITEPFLKPLSHEEYAILKEKQRAAYDRMKAKIFIIKK